MKIVKAFLSLYIILLVIGLLSSFVQINSIANNEDSFYHMWAASWLATVGSSIIPGSGYKFAVQMGSLYELRENNWHYSLPIDSFDDIDYNEAGARIGSKVGNFTFAMFCLVVGGVLFSDKRFNRWVENKLRQL